MKGNLKRINILLLATLITSLLLAGFSIGRASAASTGCFNDTNGHWAETFICWLKDNGITSGIGNGNYGPEQNVTRAQMAVFMNKLAQVPPSTGQIIINTGPDRWQVGYSADAAMSRYNYDTYTSFTRSATSLSRIFRRATRTARGFLSIAKTLAAPRAAQETAKIPVPVPISTASLMGKRSKR